MKIYCQCVDRGSCAATLQLQVKCDAVSHRQMKVTYIIFVSDVPAPQR